MGHRHQPARCEYQDGDRCRLKGECWPGFVWSFSHRKLRRRDLAVGSRLGSHHTWIYSYLQWAAPCLIIHHLAGPVPSSGEHRLVATGSMIESAAQMRINVV